jgi:hypothetical protein
MNIDIEEAKKILGKSSEGLSDEQIQFLLDQFRCLARLLMKRTFEIDNKNMYNKTGNYTHKDSK